METSTDWLTLRSADLERVIRLATELREFVAGSEFQRRHFLARVGALVGASVTIWLELQVVPPGRAMISSAYDQGWSDDSRRTSLCQYLAAQSEGEDPTILQMQKALRFGSVVARARRQLADDKIWYGSEHFQKYRRGAGLDDCIYSTLVGRAGFQTFSLHRPLNEKPFTEPETALVGAVHAACSSFLNDAELRIVDGLSPRLRETLHWLARGLTDKQVACELEVSPHTLHGYVKTLYRRLGVSSRLELLARYGRVIPTTRGRLSSA
ncbi:MAG TPA: helix-turn-helix transcriptional regulator [Polyangiaceae bacterium]|nr:helix-turn-helix transcriptional regulator [Polyangiaceae bacterium]